MTGAVIQDLDFGLGPWLGVAARRVEGLSSADVNGSTCPVLKAKA
jgi:hypothetical protein